LRPGLAAAFKAPQKALSHAIAEMESALDRVA
jgi:hypothetical protein